MQRSAAGWRQVEAWGDLPWLVAGFSTRAGGVSTVFGPEASLNLGFGAKGGDPEGEPTVDDDAAVQENRRRLIEAVGEGSWQLVVVRQVHGVELRQVTHETVQAAMVDGRGQWQADGLVTRERGLLLGAGAADCVPLLLVDVRLRAVAAVHAGWRGMAAGMAGAAVAKMKELFGTVPEDCRAVVGPSIGACCYEVGEEVAEQFAVEPGVAQRSGERWRLDLWEANRRQLERAGVPAVTVWGECTACTMEADGGRRYFSHRAERGRAGRMLGVIGVRG